MMRVLKMIVGSLLLFSVAACSAPLQADISSQAENVSIPESEDLFLVKTELRYAKTFTVEYHENYKLVTVLQPWRSADITFTYILVQRGTPIPQVVGDAQVIEIPVQQVASLATTHLPYLDALGLVDRLVAVGNLKYVNTQTVVDWVAEGGAAVVGNGPDVNIEALLAAEPDMVTTAALGNASKDDYQLLIQKGLKTVVISDFMEETPLGRAEWIKFMALFFNLEEQAEAIFSGIEEHYQSMSVLTKDVQERPTVLMGFEINGKWNMPGGRHYQAAYIADAGGDYLWAQDDSSGKIPLSFEAVLATGTQADYWFNQSVSWQDAEDVLAADVRYAHFTALENGHAYNNNARMNDSGGNDYNEGGHLNPDVVLADLIAILHPKLLPEHELVYYHLLDKAK